MNKDSFGFRDAVEEASSLDVPSVTPKTVDRERTRQGRAVAAEAGFHRRTALSSDTKPVQVKKRAVGRIRITEAAPRKSARYQGEARVQLNIQSPIQVAEQWRQLVDEIGINQWELIEKSIPLLKKVYGK